jgi:hypothetical protein
MAAPKGDVSKTWSTKMVAFDSLSIDLTNVKSNVAGDKINPDNSVTWGLAP